jgi:hypothetical protein
MKKQPKPKGYSIALQKELLEYRPASDLTLRDLYQEKADLEKERLLIFESAQNAARELSQNEKDRENEILQSLLKLAVAETHLRRDLDRRRASAGPAPIEESPADIDQSVEAFKNSLDPAEDATRAAASGYDERLKAYLTAKMERMRWLTQETAATKEKVRGALRKITSKVADDDLSDSAEVIARALVTARISDSWTPSSLLGKFQRHVGDAKRSLTETEKWLRRIDIDLREIAASDHSDDLQTSVSGQLLDADWEPGPLITSSVDSYLGFSISSALEATRSTNLILKIPGISAPKGAPRNHGRFAVYLVAAYVFHRLTGQKPASIGTDDGRPSGKQWNLCEEIWRIGWPEDANRKGAKPPEDTIRKAFKTFRDEHLRKRGSCDACRPVAT